MREPEPVKSDSSDVILIELASLLNLSPSEIVREKRLSDYGLDSIQLVSLAHIISQRLQIEIEPTLLSEYPNIGEMAHKLSQLKNNQDIRLNQQCKQLINFNIVASFTAEPIEESMTYLFKRLSYEPVINFAPYNQVFQQLIDLSSLLYAKSHGSIILFRWEDIFRFEQDCISKARLDETFQYLLVAIKKASLESAAPILFCLCPHTAYQVHRLGLTSYVDEMDNRLIAVLLECSGIYFLDLRSLQKTYQVRRIFDEGQDKMGHIPFYAEYFSAMGCAVSKKLYALINPSYKVIVVDCDNTLWRGVCGEDGPLQVEINADFASFQRFLLAQKNQGKLICLCSKNVEADVWAVFNQNSAMVLKETDIAAYQINWDNKSRNLIELSKILNLGLDSFIFIDDNPLECQEVREAIPEALVIQLPTQSCEISLYFMHHWAFEVGKLTKEDRLRNQNYLDNKKRNDIKKSSLGMEDFIKQLNINIKIEALIFEDIARASQLTQRTNQFNATTIRRTESDIQKILQHKHQDIYSVRVSDKFGDYGFVGLIILDWHHDYLLIDTFLMSCRVLGRNVEQTMLRYISNCASKLDIKFVRCLFKKSEKNLPVKAFYDSLQLTWVQSSQGEAYVQFKSNEIDNILSNSMINHKVVESVLPCLESETTVNNVIDKANKLDDIAKLQSNILMLMDSIKRLFKIPRPSLETLFVTPRTTWQKEIAMIWSDVLRIESIGIYDNFYHLGGDSLKAAEAFSRMWDLGIPHQISLQTMLEPTIAGIDQAIEDLKCGRPISLLTEKFSLENEGELPEDIVNPHMTNPLCYDGSIKSVFITGTTGYVGAFLLSELLIQTQAKVFCLVRAATLQEGLEKIRLNLMRYDLWTNGYIERIKIVIGELTEPHFGMGLDAFNQLAFEVDTIFHCAAWVNFVYPYQHLKRTNVDAVETILRLGIAESTKVIPIHFISTFGVIMSPGYKNCVVSEEQSLGYCEGLLNGYEQSKYVSDKMMWNALKERGIPVNIYRPALISGLSTSGVYHKLDEFLPSFLKGCIQLGSWPIIDSFFEMAPIDFTTKAIIHIAKQPQHLGKVYFTLHPDSRPVTEYIQWHQNAGYSIRALPWDIWKKEFIDQDSRLLRKNALFPFMDFIRALSEEQVYFPKVDKSNFIEAIKDLNFDCPHPLSLLARYTDYFIQQGFYPKSLMVNE